MIKVIPPQSLVRKAKSKQGDSKGKGVNYRGKPISGQEINQSKWHLLLYSQFH